MSDHLLAMPEPARTKGRGLLARGGADGARRRRRQPRRRSAGSPRPKTAGRIRSESRQLLAEHRVEPELAPYASLLGLLAVVFLVEGIVAKPSDPVYVVLTAPPPPPPARALRGPRSPGRVGSPARRWGRRWSLTTVIEALTGGVDQATVAVANAFLVALAPAAILIGVIRRLTAVRAVTVEAVIGVLSVYLLIGMCFAFVYAAIDRLSGPFFVQDVSATVSQCQYFSFTTIATVGYGDLTARTNLGHTLSVFEAVLGQVDPRHGRLADRRQPRPAPAGAGRDRAGLTAAGFARQGPGLALRRWRRHHAHRVMVGAAGAPSVRLRPRHPRGNGNGPAGVDLQDRSRAGDASRPHCNRGARRSRRAGEARAQRGGDRRRPRADGRGRTRAPAPALGRGHRPRAPASALGRRHRAGARPPALRRRRRPRARATRAQRRRGAGGRSPARRRHRRADRCSACSPDPRRSAYSRPRSKARSWKRRFRSCWRTRRYGCWWTRSHAAPR